MKIMILGLFVRCLKNTKKTTPDQLRNNTFNFYSFLYTKNIQSSQCAEWHGQILLELNFKLIGCVVVFLNSVGDNWVVVRNGTAAWQYFSIMRQVCRKKSKKNIGSWEKSKTAGTKCHASHFIHDFLLMDENHDWVFICSMP